MCTHVFMHACIYMHVCMCLYIHMYVKIAQLAPGGGGRGGGTVHGDF